MKTGINRGDIFHIEKYQTIGSEQFAGRPAVVVSNNVCNKCSPVVEIVYLSTKQKRLPTHVSIQCLQKESIALCEQITSVAKERIAYRYGRVSEEEMRQIEAAMRVSLAIETEDRL